VVAVLVPELIDRVDDGVVRPLWVWRPPSPVLAVSSAVLGGGIGPRGWVLNATVSLDYDGADPVEDLSALAHQCALDGQGIGLLTAVDVRAAVSSVDQGVEVTATVGLTWPTWAAAPHDGREPDAPGTVNVVAWVPVRLDDGALVNAATTAAEAKAQALVEIGVPGTGTASDALAVCCPLSGPAEPYAGPRSTWGARLARAVHQAVRSGALADRHR